jgi:acyl-CoA thioesterase FadM
MDGQATRELAGPGVSSWPGLTGLRPLREGANIRTWIGFKHFMYLAEEAVLAWFRERDLGPSRLYHEFGLGFTIAESSVQLPAVLDVDDVVDCEVSGGPDRFTVRLRARRPGSPCVLLGKVRVALVREAEAAEAAEAAGPAPAPVPVPAIVARLAVDSVADVGLPGRADLIVAPGAAPADVAAAEPGAFCWSWRIPYFYCQFSGRMQHSGHVRAMEEVVDRFLADRGLSVGTLLTERGWIPVVSRAKVSLLADAFMEETLLTVLTVTDVLKGVSFDARMDCYADRGSRLVHVATGRILHAYAIARGPGAGGLAELDQATIDALTRGNRG